MINVAQPVFYYKLTVAQAARDLDLHENVLRKWVRQYRDDPAHAFPGAGQLKPKQAEIAQLKKEVRKLKAERDILKKALTLSNQGFSKIKSWRCPTLTWGDPTLPSALSVFTSEFEKGSGGSHSLLPPGKLVCL